MIGRSRYLTQTVTFTGRRLSFDVDGNPVRDRYGNDVYEDVPFTLGPPQNPGDVDQGCSWEPRLSTSDESNDAEQHVVSGINLYCKNPQVDVRSTDKATIDGLVYEVDGPVARFTGSAFGNDHAYIVLNRVTG